MRSLTPVCVPFRAPILILSSFFGLGTGLLHAGDVLDLDLDELAAVRVNLASNLERPVREQPAIVSVVRFEDYRPLGSRDLLDILQFVPGYSFATDIGGVVGPVFRGIWAYEGKIQLIIDGIESNEGTFGTLQLNRHYSAEQIERVEIIRGPGSALYGGTAELGVIRITTKGAEQNGGFATASVGVAPDVVRQQYDFGFGYTLPQDWRISLSGGYRDDVLSDRDYEDLAGDSYSLAEESWLNPWNLNLGLGWKDLNIRLLYDYYDIHARHSVGPVASPRAYEFQTFAVQGRYDFKVDDWFTLTPKFTYREQYPWRRVRADGVQSIAAFRETYDLNTLVRLHEDISLLAGVEYYHDRGYAESLSRQGDPNTFFDSGRSVSFDDYSAFAQLDWDFDWFNLSVGGRYEDHSALDGGAFVPRIALTRAWQHWHAKALYAQAYRTPNIRVIREAIPEDDPLEAERSYSAEFELGYTFDNGWTLVGNVFDNEVDGVYEFVDLGIAGVGYLHEGDVGSRGVEMEVRHQGGWGRVAVGYSYYTATHNTVPRYQTGDEDCFFAAPAHKLTGELALRLGRSWTLGFTALYNSPMLAVASENDAGDLVVSELEARVLLGTYLEYTYQAFSLGVGVSDVLDEGRLFPAATASGNAPLPDMGREFYAKATLRF